MVRPLTKPQVRFLVKAMREGAVAFGPTERVASNLEAMGFVSTERDRLFTPTLEGLKALRDYRYTQYANHGSTADLMNIEEVEKALSEGASA